MSGDAWDSISSPVAPAAGNQFDSISSPVTVRNLAPIPGAPVADDYNTNLSGAPKLDAGRVAGLTGQSLLNNVQSTGDQIAAMSPFGSAMHMLDSVGQSSQNIAALLQLATAPAGAGPPKSFPTREQFENPGIFDFSGTSPLPRIPQIAAPPANAGERLISTGASMLPALVMGPQGAAGLFGQIAQRATGVGAATLGSFGAGEAGRALGANDTEQSALGLAGAIAGGGASRIGIAKGPTPFIPGTPPEAAPVPLPHVIRALKYVAGKTGTPDPVMLEANANGKPTTLFQRSGQPGTDAMLTLTAKPGKSAAALKEYAGSPVEPDPDHRGVLGDFNNRAQDDFTRITGVSPRAASGNMTDLSEELRGSPGGVRDAYHAALFDGDTPRPATMTPHLAAILQEPEVAKAVKTAQRLIGTTSTTGGLKVDPATGAQAIDPTTQQPIIEQQPTAQTLDLAKKTLQKTIARHPDGSIIMSGDKGVGNDVLQNHLHHLTAALAGDEAAGIDPAVPGYRSALNLGGDVLSMEHAFKRGQSTIFDRFTPRAEHDAEFEKLSPGDQEAWRGGVANAIRTKAVNGNLGTKSFSLDEVGAKMNTIFGPEKTSKLLQAMSQEKAIKDSLTRAQARNNSTTGTIAEGSKDMDAAGLGPLGTGVVHGATMGALTAVLGPGAGVGYGVNVLRTAVPKMVAKAFEMPEGARDVAGRLLMSPTMTPEGIQALLSKAQAAKPRLTLRPPRLPMRGPIAAPLPRK